MRLKNTQKITQTLDEHKINQSTKMTNFEICNFVI